MGQGREESRVSSKCLGCENGRKAEMFTEKEKTEEGANLWESSEFRFGHGEISIPLRPLSGDDE